MDLDQKQIWAIGVSSLIVAITSYYFLPGAGTLTNAVWYGVSNAFIDLLGTILVNMFFA